MNKVQEIVDMCEYLLDLFYNDLIVRSYIPNRFYNAIHWIGYDINKAFTEPKHYIPKTRMKDCKYHVEYTLNILNETYFPFNQYENFNYYIKEILEFVDITLVMIELTN